jgi:DNA-binding response OmpR family regulator
VRNFRRKGVAIVIESGELVHTICDFLNSFGYETISAPTHALAAERALQHHQIALLASAVPAPDESMAGIYLEEASKRHSHIAVVLMLSDPLEQSPGMPACAVKIVKPFGYETLIEAIELSELRALKN